MNAMTTETITDWCAAHNVRVEIERDRGMQVENAGTDRAWEHHAYVLALHVDDRGRTGITWAQGTGVETSPTDRPDEVLDSLISDALGYISADSFEDFAAEFGYDEDSRKAEATYRACGEIAKWLVRLVGGQEAFDYLAYKVERL